MRVVTLCGSLRSDSWNRKLLDAAVALKPGWEFIDGAIGALPHYNQDLDEGSGPESVAALRGQVSSADGLLVATPEYNGGVPGVLKNAIDWLSRPAFAGVAVGKPVALIAASPSRSAPARTLEHTGDAFELCLANVLRPGISFGSVSQLVGEEGLLRQEVLEELSALLDALESASLASTAGELATDASAN
jgi:chromate reductase